jgi:AcrR family transcriptional regulator
MGDQVQSVQGNERRSRILEAAFEEFSARGYEGATIKGIAGRAALRSAALIYWYFPNKEALFGAVLAERVPVLRAVVDLEALIHEPPREVLWRLGRAYLLFDEENTRALKLIVGEAVRRPEVAVAFVAEGPGRVLGFLQAYLERQVELGRLREHDASSSARAFVGMLAPQVAANVFLLSLLDRGPTNEEHLETCVEIFLRGLEGEGEGGGRDGADSGKGKGNRT